jgi:hypothetical protein
VRSGPPPAAATARPKPAPVRHRDDDEDDDDREEEDRPVRKRSRKSKKKKGNTALVLGLVGGGVALAAGIVVLVVFLLRSTPQVQPTPAPVAVAEVAAGLPKGTGQEDLLNFVPIGCNVFAGADLGFIAQQPEMAQQWQMGINMGLMQVPGAPPGAAELIADIDRVLFALNLNEKGGPGGGPMPEGVLVLRMRNPYDPQKLRQILQVNDAPEQIKDKSCYRLSNMARGAPNAPLLYMPNDRVIVFAGAPQPRLANVLTFTGVAPSVGPEAVAQVRGVDSAMFWGAVEVTPVIREQLAKLDPKQLDQYPELKPAVGPLQQMKGAGIAFGLGQGKKVRISVSATCANASDSQQLSSALNDFWEKKGKGQLAMMKAFMPQQPGQPGIGPVMDELMNSLAVKQLPDAKVELAVELSEQTLKGLQAQQGQLQQLFGAGAAPGGPGMRPPPPPPQFQPGARSPVRKRPAPKGP